MTTNLYRALFYAFSDGREFVAGDVIAESRKVATRPQLVLADVLRETFGQNVTGRKVGHWLNKNIALVPDDLNLTVDEDRHRCQKVYAIWKKPTAAEFAAADVEDEKWMHNLIEKRSAKMAGKDLTAQVKQLERDQRKLDKPDEDRRKVEAKTAAREQRELDKKNEKLNEVAQQAIDEQMAARTVTTIAPRIGFWVEERRANRILNQFVDKGFRVTVQYIFGGRAVLRVDGAFDLSQLQAVCLRLGLVVRQEKPLASTAKESNEQIWNNDLQRWEPKPTKALPLGYDVDARYLHRTADGPRRRVGGAIQYNPFAEMFPGWRIF